MELFEKAINKMTDEQKDYFCRECQLTEEEIPNATPEVFDRCQERIMEIIENIQDFDNPDKDEQMALDIEDILEEVIE